MTTRRQFILIGGVASVAGFTGGMAWRSGHKPSGTLIIRTAEIPRSALATFDASGSETIFSGDYAALVELAGQHFAKGGSCVIAAVDHAGALLLARTLRGHAGIRIAEHRLPHRNGQKFNLVIAERGGKA
jgi:hypothetical protein